MERKVTNERMFEELIEECEELLKKEKNSIKILNILGRSYYNIKKTSEAKKYFERSIDLDINNIDAHNGLGLVYKEIGEYDKALNEFNNILTKCNYADVHKNLGDVYLKTGLLDKAFFEYKSAYEINPYYIEAVLALVDLYEQMNMYAEALEMCRNVIKDKFFKHIQSNRTKIRHDLAKIYQEKNFFEAAIMHYKAVLQEHPEYVDIHYSLGVIYKSMGEIDKAMECFKEAILLNPKHQKARDEYWSCSETN